MLRSASTIIALLTSCFCVVSAPQTAIAKTTKTVRILVLGDSLTEGYLIDQQVAFPALLEKELNKRHAVEVINAGIGGSTTASAAPRLKQKLENKPDIVILALGGNDGLRGLSVSAMKDNLGRAISLAKKNGIKVLLAGMKIPPNFGPDYTESFAAVFPALADEHDVPLIPFLLEGVGGEANMNLPDGIHPNEKGHQRMFRNVLPHLERLL